MKEQKIAKAITTLILVLILNPLLLMGLLYIFGLSIGFFKAFIITLAFNILNGDYGKKI
jgi:hypothetical protein